MRLLLLLLIIIAQSWAIPQFAREYQTDCATCHTNIPMLNETGERFLRNGFRFSPDDIVSLKEFITHENRQYEPFGAMVGFNYSDKNKNNELTGKVKLYFAGTLSQYLSVFASTHQTINTESKNGPKLFKEASSRAYIQLAAKEPQHLLRAGLLHPFTQLGNIQRAFADSGLNGIVHPSMSGSQHGNRDGRHGSNVYKSALQNGGISAYKGMEYSYLYDEKILFLLAYGKVVSHGKEGSGRSMHNGFMGNMRYGGMQGAVGSEQHGGMGSLMHSVPFERAEYQTIAAVRYQPAGGVKIGFIYTNQDNGDETYLIPIEKNFDSIYVNVVGVYRSSAEDYTGTEGSVMYAFDDTMYLRALVSYGKREGQKSETGCSLMLSKRVSKVALIHIIGSYVDPSNLSSDTRLSIALNLFF